MRFWSLNSDERALTIMTSILLHNQTWMFKKMIVVGLQKVLMDEYLRQFAE